MRLSELNPEFYRYEERVEPYSVVDGTWDGSKYVMPDGRTWDAAGRPTKEIVGPREYMIKVLTLAEAQGIMFLCPTCYKNNGGEEGTHHVHMPFANRGVDPVAHVHQWSVVQGTGFEDLSTQPSYLIIGGCNWHGYITNGDVSII